MPDREIRTKRWCFTRKTDRRVPSACPTDGAHRAAGLAKVSKETAADPVTEPRPYRNQTTRRTPRSLAACEPFSEPSFARERGGRLPGLRLPSSRGGPEGLCRMLAKDTCSDTFAYRLHGILLLLERSRRIPALRAIFLCMKDVVRTIDAHVIHKTIHSMCRIHHGWRLASTGAPPAAIPARPQGSGGRGALRPPLPWTQPPNGRR